MIRPLTIATCLMACGSGLYLYQSKHEVQLLDRTIERTVHDTAALREQSRLLAAEWTMLTNPERLRQFSDTYLILKTISPQQFSSLADLDGRLPPPQTEDPASDATEPEQTPEATASVPSAAVMPSVAVTPQAGAPDPVATADATPTLDAHLPLPPVPKVPRTAGVTVFTRPTETRPPDRPPVQHTLVTESQPHSTESRSAEQRAPEPRVSEPRAGRLADARPDARVLTAPPLSRPIVPVPARPAPVAAGPANGPLTTPPNGPPAVVPARLPIVAGQPIIAGTSPNGGSLLGMARGSSPPSPRPTPVNATYNAN